MKQQWIFIFALLFALVIAVLSVVNVESVPVDYVFGTAEFPLIMVMIGSAFSGGLVVGLFGTIRIIKQNRKIRSLQKELQAAKSEATESNLPAMDPNNITASEKNDSANDALKGDLPADSDSNRQEGADSSQENRTGPHDKKE